MGTCGDCVCHGNGAFEAKVSRRVLVCAQLRHRRNDAEGSPRVSAACAPHSCAGVLRLFLCVFFVDAFVTEVA